MAGREGPVGAKLFLIFRHQRPLIVISVWPCALIIILCLRGHTAFRFHHSAEEFPKLGRILLIDEYAERSREIAGKSLGRVFRISDGNVRTGCETLLLAVEVLILVIEELHAGFLRGSRENFQTVGEVGIRYIGGFPVFAFGACEIGVNHSLVT